MSDEVYKQRKITKDEIKQHQQQQEIQDPLQQVKSVQKSLNQETGKEMTQQFPPNSPDLPEIKGNIPPEFKKLLQQKAAQPSPPPPPPPTQSASPQPSMPTQPPVPPSPPNPPTQQQVTPPTPPAGYASDNLAIQYAKQGPLQELLQRLASYHHWEEFELASKGKFYTDIPSVIHIRPMTGEEEQILATPRFIKRGVAIDMIFSRCIQESIEPEKLLSADRTHLLIYLRGISYTPEYDVEVRCPSCEIKFNTTIDLNMLEVEECPDDFGPDNLQGVLPTTGFKYKYRYATGKDEQIISQYREKQILKWGDQREDDTLIYRTAMLITELEGITNNKDIHFLMKKLPISDVNHLRNEVSNPPFGVKTDIDMICPSCSEEFVIDLPLEANFFFPKKRTK